MDVALGGFVRQKVRSYAQFGASRGKVKFEEVRGSVFGVKFDKLWTISTQIEPNK